MTPTNPTRPRLADADLPVLTQVAEVTPLTQKPDDGFHPAKLKLRVESGVLRKKSNTFEEAVTDKRPLLTTLHVLMARAGVVTDGSSNSVEAKELTMVTKNGRTFAHLVKRTDSLDAEAFNLSLRAQQSFKGLESVEVVSAEPAPAPAPAAAPVDFELPAPLTGDERTVIFTPQDHNDMAAGHAREQLAQVTADAQQDRLDQQSAAADKDVDQLTGGQQDRLDNIFDDSAFDDEEPKKTWRQRILAGLPGALTSGAVVAATKVGVMSALGASVSAFALAPAITTIAGVGAGIFVGQSVAHLRARWSEAEAAKGEKISLKQVFQGCAKGENLSREFQAYRDAINNRDGKQFWKQALIKGTFAASIGAAVAWTPELIDLANKTQTGASITKGISSAFNTVSDKAASALSSAKSFFSKSIFAGKAPVAVPAQVAAPAAAPASAPAAAAAPPATPAAVEPPAAAAAPVEAATLLTPLDKVRAMLKDLGVSDTAANKLLDRPTVTEAQRINDVAVGLNNGVYGMPLNKDTARDLFQTAKDMGNAKSGLDLDVATGKVAPPAPVAAPDAAPAPLAGEAGITDATRRAAYEQVGLPFPEAAAPAAPAEAAPLAPAAPIDLNRPLTEADAPVRVGTEVARCVMEQVEKGKMAIRSLCSVFSNAMQPNDVVLVEGKGLGTVPYANDSADVVDTESFMHASRRDYRDWSFVPWLKREAN